VRRDLAILLLATAVSCPLGLAIGHPWLLPALNALPAYLVLVHRLRKGERGGAVRAMLWWAAAVAIVGTIAMALWPSPVDGVVWNGPAYETGMLAWVRTGQGAEGNIRLFLPGQLVQLAAFVLLSLLTAGALSVLMGAVILNFLSFYAASLVRAGVPEWAVVPFGWPPWVVARIAALCILGVVLAEPLLFRVFPSARQNLKVVGRMPYYVAAISSVLADWFLRAAFAPLWAKWLRGLLP